MKSVWNWDNDFENYNTLHEFIADIQIDAIKSNSKVAFDHQFKQGWNAAIETACNELQQFVHKDHTVADIEKTLLKLKITK